MRRSPLGLTLLASLALASLPSHATTASYGYDANGNRISGDGQHYEYDDANRLVRIRQGNASGPVVAEFFHDHAKYQAPQPEHPEHPDTAGDLPDAAIHANPLEGHNAALRRRNSAFRRGTNTYAKNADAPQRTLDVHRLQHHCVRPHWSTGEAPAVRSGLLAAPLRLAAILMMRKAA